ncbi:MAG: hypothetical protein A2W90_10965 [Bacteroidetes bacterium GWF2_42_66]|nr:MAG: hypothetical protein A2W92_09955 [Bacteroidetes bacterium GWA2_42_15]OFY01902.1 MAG: hypothetical protein A2W89_23605 [Bacteroidetes bacterium GWE2_42_39]OFY44802.1 MAG: hypothetical protein A2W90_10965 [Bacteroidetes bacterium GWF2_42_66]
MEYTGKNKKFQSMILIPALCILGLISCNSNKQMSEGRLIQSFDCTKEYPADTYFSFGDVRVANSVAGAYREAEAKPLSRFGYRFQVEHVGKPHLAVVRYPDDKRRFMCMMDGTTYDMTIGTFTGVKQPLTNKMQEIRKVFWPRWNDCSIVFMTWGTGEPAAVADIKIYELDELQALKIKNEDPSVPKRELGLQFEDPCGTTFSMGANTEQEWLDRTVSYMRHTGQNLLTYPVVWYHDPLYPSEREPSGLFGGVAAPDRKIYTRWTSHPEDWVSILLKKFEKEDLEFNAALTLLRLGSLMKDMNINLDSIKSGKETYNNMLANNQVQSSTNDWTMEYNVANFEKQTNGTLDGWAYGEHGGPFNRGPMFNPLHPTVQKAILEIVQEIVDRYGQSPAFKGISMNMWHATILWYFSLKSGYDDYTVNLFEKETGVKVPVKSNDPERFSKRYQFLNENHSEAWINWRCKKIKELFCKMRDILTAARPDLRLTVSTWTEITIYGWFGGVPHEPSHQIFVRKSLYNLYREGGFDMNLFRNEPNIEIDYVFLPSRDRDAWGTDGAETPLEKTCSYRDHDFLDKTTLDIIGKQENPGAFIFDSWVEAWGKYYHSPCQSDDPQAKRFSEIWGKPTEGIRLDNAEYPKDGFWWNSQLRITPHFQGGIHYLEHFTHALAELDACRITRGGLFTDTGHADLIREFAQAYRTLPSEKFTTVGTSTDPVAVRTLIRDGKRYLYLVNREYYPVKVKLLFRKNRNQLTDLVSEETINASEELNLDLGPYQLRSLSTIPETEIVGFSATPPTEITTELNQKFEDTKTAISKLKQAGIELPTSMEKTVSEIESALKEGRYASVRKLLNSYAILKTEELDSGLSSKQP